MIDIKTLTAEDVTANTSYLSFKDKYIYIDNLDSKDGLVKAVDSFFNATRIFHDLKIRMKKYRKSH